MHLTTEQACKYLNCAPKTLRRYVKNGLIKNQKHGRQVLYLQSELAIIAKDITLNKAQYQPLPKSVMKDMKIVKKAIKSNSPVLLNDLGKETLKSTIQLLKNNDLLKGSGKEAVYRYSIAVQLKEHYLGLAIAAEVDKVYFDIVKQFQSEIQHYERELCITPAALRRVKNVNTEEIVIDPMEDILNG